ncbi:SusD/RagB family nutrient-binding outer membrane lipoprotein [Aequorivita todarodis]|uniref:SusD/RagB family nutrient-binding outer membrane lipoprotein n=1 Tax=Aequorivita todarodis TaxID=2036821 RepID=UPI0023502F40|nr:SusD/RagB family nutrient-binding outer membrane lipoprotein [Aequorivita todarodis]MDC8000817.1 SusD/RagB family nutrient-binding outer membrane lipoprotein [Aequorivita todarodis]
MKKLILIFTAAILAVSCSDSLEDLNENIKDPANVSGESLFASAQKQLADQVVTPNVNLNNLRLWTQQLQETTYTDESRYNQVTRSIPDNHWRVIYRDVLKDLDQASINIEATTYLTDELNGRKPNKQAIIEVLKVYAYSNLVETFGNIPYTEALDINNLLPKYDDAQTVYKDLLVRLTAAINSMDTSLNSFESGEDLIYRGDVSKWKKFANSLKLRMGLTIADFNAGLAQSTVESAFLSGVFTSNADNASYAYRNAAPNNNPMNNNLVLSGRNDYVAGATLVNMLNNVNDPRSAAYFNGKVEFNYPWDPTDPTKGNPVASVSTSGNVTTITMTKELDNLPAIGDEIYLQVEDAESILLGTASNVTSTTLEINNINTSVNAGDGIGIFSYVGGVIGSRSSYGVYTHVSDRIVNASEPGVIMSYDEVEFLLAEAAERGFNVGGNAESHYVAGITASFNYWGVSDVASYLANPKVNYTSALAASTSNPKWKMVIGEQAYFGLYNRTFAPYLSVRRLDYPILVNPVRAQSGFPVRYTYPVGEQTLNGANYNDASDALGPLGDVPEQQLFWDKFYTFDF